MPSSSSEITVGRPSAAAWIAGSSASRVLPPTDYADFVEQVGACQSRPALRRAPFLAGDENAILVAIHMSSSTACWTTAAGGAETGTSAAGRFGAG